MTSALDHKVLQKLCEIATSVDPANNTTGPTIFPEVVCLVPNGSPPGTASLIGIVVFNTSTAIPTSNLYLNNTDVTATHTQVPCTTALSSKETCYESLTEQFSRIDWFAAPNFTTPVSTAWYNLSTNVYSATAPVGVTPCSEHEVDLIKTNWLPICVGGLQYYVAETSTFDNNTEIETISKIYKLGASGIVSATTPVGTLTEGYCGGGGASTVGTAVIGTLRAITNGTVAAAKESITFIAVGGSPTVNGVAMSAGEVKSFQVYLDPVTNVYNRLPAITYTATAVNILDIHFVN